MSRHNCFATAKEAVSQRHDKVTTQYINLSLMSGKVKEKLTYTGCQDGGQVRSELQSGIWSKCRDGPMRGDNLEDRAMSSCMWEHIELADALSKCRWLVWLTRQFGSSGAMG